MNIERLIICGRLRACVAIKRAYQGASDSGRVTMMQHAIDRLLDDYNADAIFKHLAADAPGEAGEAQEGSR